MKSKKKSFDWRMLKIFMIGLFIMVPYVMWKFGTGHTFGEHLLNILINWLLSFLIGFPILNLIAHKRYGFFYHKDTLDFEEKFTRSFPDIKIPKKGSQELEFKDEQGNWHPLTEDLQKNPLFKNLETRIKNDKDHN